MATSRTDGKHGDFGLVKAIYDVRGGQHSSIPPEEIRDDEGVTAHNVISDRRGVLRKVWGTTELITGGTDEAYNKFILNPVYALYDYTMPDGYTYLVIQGRDASDGYMSLYALSKQDSYPAAVSAAPTRILGASSELTDGRRCSFATYKGRMYIWNGVDWLRYWTGNSTVWRIYHENEAERFRYLCAHARRLWAASSANNPSRLIYTNVGVCNFAHYFLNGTNYIDFDSAADYSPITHICEFKDSLLIFKYNSIYRLHGDPEYGISFNCVSQGIGTIDGGSVQVHKNTVYFAWEDGIYVYGDLNIAASAEDMALRVEPNVVRISSEIDDYWEDNIVLPSPYKTKEKVWSGSTDFGNFTLSSCEANTAPITENPDVINAYLLGEDSTSAGYYTKVQYNETPPGNWVAMNDLYGKNQYFSQSAKLDTSTAQKSVPRYVGLYLKETGTLASGDKLNVYVCDGKNSDTEPDFDNVYAEGQLTYTYLHGVEELVFDGGTTEPTDGVKLYKEGDHNVYGTLSRKALLSGAWSNSDAAGSFYLTDVAGTWLDDDVIELADGTNIAVVNGGDTSPISTGCWVYVEMTYFDYPQGLYNYEINIANAPTFFIAVKVESMDSTNYLSWDYTTSNAYSGGRMYNSDSDTPGTQSDCDYNFRLYCGWFNFSSTIETGTLDVSGEGLANWGNVFVVCNEDTIYSGGTYDRRMMVQKVWYEIRTADSGWGTWTETVNGGGLDGTGEYLRLKIVFVRYSGYDTKLMDSMTVQSIRVTYNTQVVTDRLISSAMWNDSYVLACEVDDQAEANGDCLYFTGTSDDDCDYVEIADSSTLDPGTSDFAFSFDVRCSADNQIETQPFVFAKVSDRGGAGEEEIYSFEYTPATDTWTVNMNASDSACFSVGQAFTKITFGDDQWHTIVCSFDRDGNFTLYADGQLEHTMDMSNYSTKDVSSTLPLILGTNHPTSYTRKPFVGYLDNFQFYKRTIDATEALYLYNNSSTNSTYSTTNLTMHLKMGEGYGLHTYDETSNNNDGALGGTGHSKNRVPAWALR